MLKPAQQAPETPGIRVQQTFGDMKLGQRQSAAQTRGAGPSAARIGAVSASGHAPQPVAAGAVQQLAQAPPAPAIDGNPFKKELRQRRRRAPRGFDVGLVPGTPGSIGLKGIDLGVRGMRVGGVRRLIVPPELGFGNRQAGELPPNSTIEVDIELLSIKSTRIL
ncbi:hypothetical protein Rsub_13100 [Raphidocelis subcapitata]|uniref:peptidylprolyl isomerase n=1 Tax=Raphidocelis subcapitata TaxID=307507 RepID=A0A2V0PLA1_9CHLO|nr:hypothetical protein Rsub_13100 [Raphidocelis subcapitata]|eukprot:GBG00330.1 hypothetical protein Rsub_13100 [Raphidocelis subcapitata]